MNLTTGDALTSGLQRADTENTQAVLQDIDAYNFMLGICVFTKLSKSVLNQFFLENTFKDAVPILNRPIKK